MIILSRRKRRIEATNNNKKNSTNSTISKQIRHFMIFVTSILVMMNSLKHLNYHRNSLKIYVSAKQSVPTHHHHTIRNYHRHTLYNTNSCNYYHNKHNVAAFNPTIRRKFAAVKSPYYSSSPSCLASTFSSSTASSNTVKEEFQSDGNNNNNDNEEEEKFSNYITTKKKADKFHNLVEQENDSINYPKGIPDGFYIIKQYNMPGEDILDNMLQDAIEQTATLKKQEVESESDAPRVGITQEELDRLGINSAGNMTLPIALMLLDPVEYPSFSKARKACRKGYIIIHRGPLDTMDVDEIDPAHEEEGVEMSENKNTFNLTKCIRGRVGDRVYPNDVIGRQVRMHGGFYPGLDCKKPPFDLPVVYEDDHFAIVNKPAGIVVYSQRKQGHGMMTVRAALPFFLKPPKRGTLAIIRRPISVHRLDKPTSGLLLIAKTKPAMVDLTKQFVERRVKKTYTAIVNGIPDEPVVSSMSALDAHKMGVDVDYSTSSSSSGVNDRWQLIDSPLDDGNSVKSAVTIWKPLQYIKSLKAKDGTLTKVELKPKTGRYHQLRRHMAWVKDCPLVGDKEYDGGGDAMDLRGRGLFLCSNKVTLDHPYYNTEVGRKEWENLSDDVKWANGMIKLSDDGDKKIVQVSASIDLPGKFDSFLKSEEERAEKFASDNND